MKELTDIINWRRVNEKVTTSGQPTEEQLRDIKALNVTHIVNLGPHDNDGAVDDEAASVKSLGMTYVYIPVDFSAPTDEDFSKFCEVLDELEGKDIHIHCIYNARVSAFFYRYAKADLGGDKDDAFARMDSIWRPGDDWAEFIGEEQAKGQPNLYAGDDY